MTLGDSAGRQLLWKGEIGDCPSGYWLPQGDEGAS